MYPYDIFKKVKIREVIIIYIMAILISIIGTVIVVKYCGIKLNDTLINYSILSIEVLTALMILFKIGASLGNIKILYSDCMKKINAKEALEVVLIYLIIVVGGSLITIKIIYLFSPELAEMLVTQVPIVVNTPIDYIINFVYLVIIVPINEELIFRHIIFDRMCERVSVYTAIIAVAIVFASINICAGIIGAFCLSVINSIIYLKYKNITIPIINRALINITAIIILLPMLNYYRKYGIEKSVILKNSVLGIFMLCVGGYMFVKLVINNKKYIDEFTNS